MEHRNTLIVSKAQHLVLLGHKVMIITERRSHCEVLQNELKKVNIDGGLCYGGINNFELEKSKEKAVLLGTYSYVKEGFDPAYSRCHDSGHTEIRCSTSVRTHLTLRNKFITNNN